MSKILVFFSFFWLILLFFFTPHYIELTGVLETWFPYKGLIYYKEFAAYHFPLGRLILLPVHILSNWNLELDPFLGLFFGLGTLILIYLFGKRYLSPWGTAISLTFFSGFFWFAANGIIFFHEILIGFLLMLTIYFLFNAYRPKNFSNKTVVRLGLLISITELTGQIVTITLGVITLASVLLITKTFKQKLLSNIYFLAGLIFPFLITIIYFSYNKALYEFFRYNVTYYFLYANYKKDSLLDLPFESLSLFYLPAVLLFLILIIYLIKGLRNKIYKPTYILISTLTISTIPFILFSVYHPHHLNYALPVLSIAFGFSLDLSRRLGRIGKVLAFSGIIIFLIMFLIFILPWHLSRVVYPPNFRIVNDLIGDSRYSVYNLSELISQKVSQIILPPELAPTIQYPSIDISQGYNIYNESNPIYSTVEWLTNNTSPADKIMVMGDPIIYLRSNRLPASRPSKSIPYGWEPTLIKNEIENNRADYWIVDQDFTKKLIQVYQRKDMVDFLNTELEYCYKKEVVYTNWEIWKKVCE